MAIRDPSGAEMTVRWLHDSGPPTRARCIGGKQGCRRLNATEGNLCLAPVTFSEHPDMAAAKAFFPSAKMVIGVTPNRVATDGHDSYPRAIRTTLGKTVKHRTSRYLDNRLEQDHRGIKGRYWPMLGFTQKPVFNAIRAPKNPNQISVLEMPPVTLHAALSVNVRAQQNGSVEAAMNCAISYILVLISMSQPKPAGTTFCVIR